MFLFSFQREISEMRWPIGAKICTIINSKLSFIMPVQNFREPSSKKFYGQKTCKIWPDFGRLWSSANFGGEYLRKGWRYSNQSSTFCKAIPPALGEKMFGKLRFTNHGD